MSSGQPLVDCVSDSEDAVLLDYTCRNHPSGPSLYGLCCMVMLYSHFTGFPDSRLTQKLGCHRDEDHVHETDRSLRGGTIWQSVLTYYLGGSSQRVLAIRLMDVRLEVLRAHNRLEVPLVHRRWRRKGSSGSPPDHIWLEVPLAHRRWRRQGVSCLGLTYLLSYLSLRMPGSTGTTSSLPPT